MHSDDRKGRDISRAAELAGYVKCQILTGVYSAGDRLPTATQMAKYFGVDPNTARAAYGRLKADGLVTSTRGKGTFVSATVRTGDTAKLNALLDETIKEANKLGLSPDELATIVWVHGRFACGGPKIWYVDDWHPYMEAFAHQLQGVVGLPIVARTANEICERASPGAGPTDGDVVIATRFNLEKVRELVADDRLKFVAISPRMAPKTLAKLRELPESDRLGVICVEAKFAEVSGKIIARSGVGLPQVHGNTTDIETLSEVYMSADVLTISTVALGRLEAAGARLPDKTIVPFSYEIEPGSLKEAAEAVHAVIQ